MKWQLFLLVILIIPLVNAETYTDNINKYFLKTDTYAWTPQHEGKINSVTIDGEITGTGRVRVHLIRGGEQNLIYSRTQQEDVKVGDYVELEEGSDIGLVLNYGNTQWDKDDDGLDQEGIDYKIEPIFFSSLNEENLCTVWEVYSVENDKYTRSCYGSTQCCSFLGEEQRLDDWEKEFVLVQGADGATKHNIVLSRLVYFNGTKVGYSNYDALPGVFVQGDVDAGINTSLLDNSKNILRISLDENTYFDLKSITYDVEKEETIQPTEEVKIEETKIDDSPEIIQTENTFSAQIPILTREKFLINNSLPIEVLDVKASQSTVNGKVSLRDETSTEFLNIIVLEIPEKTEAILDLKIPINEIHDGQVAIFWWNDTWIQENVVFLRSDLNYSYYRTTIPKSTKVGIKIQEPEKVKFHDLGAFWYIIIAFVISLIVLFGWGIRKILYTEAEVRYETWKFDNDIKKIHKMVKKYR